MFSLSSARSAGEELAPPLLHMLSFPELSFMAPGSPLSLPFSLPPIVKFLLYLGSREEILWIKGKRVRELLGTECNESLGPQKCVVLHKEKGKNGCWVE